MRSRILLIYWNLQRISILAILLCSLSIFLVGCVSSSTFKSYKHEVTSAISSLQTQLAQLRYEIASLRAEIQTVSADQRSLNSDVSARLSESNDKLREMEERVIEIRLLLRHNQNFR